jgi:outer membrane protein W
MIRDIRDFALAAALAVTSGLTLALPGGALAQGGDGFLFKAPTVSIKFETGYGFQQARSDIFTFTREQLTLGPRAFDSPYVGGEVALRVADRLDVALTAGYQSSSVGSEFRGWVDTDGLPIEQVTALRLVPATVSAKFYLRERGRTIGRFAWIPTSFAPFVGAGVGVMSYRFQQVGDFVDFQTLEVFSDRFVSSGAALLGRALAGVNISLSKQFLFTTEARYGWASGQVRNDFSGFSTMDLDGLQLVGGIAVRF